MAAPSTVTAGRISALVLARTAYALSPALASLRSQSGRERAFQFMAEEAEHLRRALDDLLREEGEGANPSGA